MKIAFASFYNGEIYRGVETYVFELSNRLTDLKHDVSVYQNGPVLENSKYQTKVRNLPINWQAHAPEWLKRTYLDYWNLLVGRFTLKLLPSILKTKPKIVVACNGGWQPAILRIATWLYGGKLIISSQAGIGFDDINNLYCFPDRFVAISNYAKKWAHKMNPLVKLTKINNGVDTKKFSTEKNKFKTNLPTPIILSVGALVPMKRHHLTIQAMSKIKEGSLLIVGEGQLKDDLTKLANKLIPGRFKILNVPYSEMPTIYQAADLFAFPTDHYESFGIVLLEAMASGVPVVASNDPIRREIVGDAGMFVNPENSQEYANAIEKSLKTKWSTKPLLQAQKFDWDIIAKQYENLFLEIIK